MKRERVSRRQGVQDFADFAIALASRSAALGLVLLVAWGACRLIRTETRGGVREILETIDDNWKASLLMLVALFYQPIRNLIDRVKITKLPGLGSVEAEVVEQGPPPTPRPPAQDRSPGGAAPPPAGPGAISGTGG